MRKLLLSACCIVALAATVNAQTTVNITAPDPAAAETRPGQTPNSATVRVSRTGSTAAALVVWIKVGGAAVQNSDYSFGIPIGASVTIPAGSAHLDIPVNVLDDAAAELAEDIRAELEEETASSTPVPYNIGANDRAVIDLFDNESLPPPAIVSVTTLASAAEGTGGAPVAGTFRFSRSGDTGVAVTVAYSVEGSAVSGGDFVALSGSVFIPAGEAFADVTVTPVDDAELEGEETVALTLLPSDCASVHPLPASCYAIGAATTAELSIADNEIPPVRAVVEVAALNNAAEYSGGNPEAGAFRFTRSENLDVALTVAYSIGGAATPDADYAALSGSVAIPAGVASVDVTVSPVDDGIFEPGETVVLTISPSACPELYPPSECYLIGAAGSASLAILDDEIAPVLSVTATQNTNFVGLPAVGSGTFTAHSTNGFIVAYQVRVDGVQQVYQVISHPTPPAAGTPFEAGFALTHLPAGNRSVQVTVWDNFWNSTSVTTPLAITNIPMPTSLQLFAVDPDASETLPGEPPNPGRFRFILTGDMNLGIWDFGFAGTALRNADYTVAFDAGSFTTNGNVLTWTLDAVVTPIDDQIVESVESVDLQMCFVIIAWIYGVGAPIGTECSSFGAIINIHDNDTSSPYPVVRVTAGDADAQEVSPLSGDAPNPGAFTLTRTAPATNDVPIHYTLAGTAQNGTDYAAIAGITIISNGAMSATIPVLPLFDPLVEGNETVTLTLRPAPTPFSYLLDPGVNNSASVSIRDYTPTNLPVVRIKVTDAQAIEQPAISPHASFLVERSGGVSDPLVVPYAISGTASNGLDYVTLPGLVSFPGGGRSASIVVIPYLDAETEPDETVVITLQRPPSEVFPPAYLLGGTGSMIGSAGATIREDAPPTGPIDRFERARRLRFPGRYRIVPLPTLPVVALATNSTSAAVVWAVEASSDFKTWEEIGVTEDPEEFVDVDGHDAPQRFYRFRQVLPAVP